MRIFGGLVTNASITVAVLRSSRAFDCVTCAKRNPLTITVRDKPAA